MKVAAAILIPLVLIAAGAAVLYKTGYLDRWMGKPARASRTQASTGASGSKPARSALVRTGGAPSRTPAASIASVRPVPATRQPQASQTGDPVEAEQKLVRLAAIYEAMPPDDAVKVLPALPDTLLVQLLRRMDERVAARTLAALDRKRAVRLSLALAR